MFGVADPAAGTERIVVLAETDVVEAGARQGSRPGAGGHGRCCRLCPR